MVARLHQKETCPPFYARLVHLRRGPASFALVALLLKGVDKEKHEHRRRLGKWQKKSDVDTLAAEAGPKQRGSLQPEETLPADPFSVFTKDTMDSVGVKISRDEIVCKA